MFFNFFHIFYTFMLFKFCIESVCLLVVSSQIYRTRGPGIFYTEAQRGWQQDLEARFSIFEKKKNFLILKKVKKVRLFYLKNLQPFGRKTVHGGRRTVDGVRWTGEGGRWTVDGERRTVNVKRRTAYGRRRTGKTDGVRWTADSGRRTVDGGRGRRTVGARYGFYTLWNVNHEIVRGVQMLLGSPLVGPGTRSLPIRLIR
ncbi:unnamed protein product, partial [Nesidiocoris tenuis]